MTPTHDNPFGILPALGEVLEVNPEQSSSEGLECRYGIDVGSQEMPQVGAHANAWMVPLECLENPLGGAPVMTRAVVVNRDPDAELAHQTVQAVEGCVVRIRVGRQIPNAGSMRKLEELSIGAVIVGEAVYAMRTDGDVSPLQALENAGDLGIRCLRRQMSPVELDVMQAELDDRIQGRVELQVAQGIALDSHRETAKASLDLWHGEGTSERADEGNAGQRGTLP